MALSTLGAMSAPCLGSSPERSVNSGRALFDLTIQKRDRYCTSIIGGRGRDIWEKTVNNLFRFSEVRQNRIYLVSKDVPNFDLHQMSRKCEVLGGYLVEFDDNHELDFVQDLVTKLRGADRFFSGGNDRDTEGTFVYKKPAPPDLDWLIGSRDNYYLSHEDCMALLSYPTHAVLDDVRCKGRGKYICEVPLSKWLY
ncbi:shell fibrous prismatic perlucin-like protein 1 [Elysia marginata]|uniref:Shell fibrous prismatic perlucin-like protein 1 n=1 Tax=Elysia marginata TaxID=1093978 RepID=A0AAV4FIG6_9GAST|nr:shell fibrous prismatic perlucin-like protein 1 [Elysia marginata]